MDNFKFGLFDVFVYSLPGLIILLSIDLLFIEFDNTISKTVSEIVLQVNGLKFYTILLALITSYIFGFVLHLFGYNYFHLIGKNVWKKAIGPYKRGLSANNSDHVLIREYSKDNYVYIELWNTLRAMSFNTSLAFIFLTGVISFKVLASSIFSVAWGATILCGIGIVVVLLRRAVTFHVWSHETCEFTVKMIKETGLDKD